MAKRYVIENQQQQAELRPIASPVDTFAPPIIQAPEMQNIIDLAPLSKSFTDLASSVAAGVGEEVQKSAAAAYADAGSNVKSALENKNPEEAKKQLAALSRSKQIPEHYQPLFYKSLYTFGAKDAMSRYETALKMELDKFGTVVDENGNFMPEPAKAPEVVAQELWNTYASSPILANYDGRVEASKYLGNIQSNFVAAATETRAAALKEWRNEQISNSWGGLLKEMLEDPVAANTKLQASLAEGREMGMPDIQNKLAAAGLTVVGDYIAQATVMKEPEARRMLLDQARAVLLNMEDVQFGDKKLGDNTKISAKIAEAMASVETTEINLEEREARNKDRKAKERNEFLSQVGYNVRNSLPKDLPMPELRKQFEAKVAELYPDDSEARVSAMQQFNLYEKVTAAEIETDSSLATEVRRAIGERRYGDADNMIHTAMAEGKLSHKDFDSFFQTINAQRSAQRTAESDPNYTNRLESIQVSLGLATKAYSNTPIGIEVERGMVALREGFENELFNINSDPTLTSAQRLEKMNEVVSRAKQTVTERETELRTQVDGIKKEWVKWARGETNFTVEQEIEYSRYLPEKDVDLLRREREAIMNIPSYITDPTIGPLYDVQASLQAAQGIAATEIGERAAGSPIIQGYFQSARQAFSAAVVEVYRNGRKNSLSRSQIEEAAALAGKTAAMKELESIGAADPEVYKVIKNALMSPREAIGQMLESQIKQQETAGSDYLKHWTKRRNMTWLDYDEGDIASNTKGIGGEALGTHDLDVGDFYENLSEGRADMVNGMVSADSLIYRRDAIFNSTSGQFDDYGSLTQDPDYFKQYVTEVVRHTGLTVKEAVSLQVSSMDGSLFINGQTLNAKDINPFMTPLLLDVPPKDADYLAAQDPLKLFQETPNASDSLTAWFNRATENTTNLEHTQLKTIMSNFGLPFTEQNIERFKRSQIALTSAFFPQ